MPEFTREQLNPDVVLYHGDCLDVLPTLEPGSVDAVVTDPPYLNSDAGVPITRRGVARRIEDTESVGLPWGYSLDWIDAAARLSPRHWIVFAHYKMLGGVLTRIEKNADISCVFTWRKVNAPRMVRPVPRHDCEFIVWAKRSNEPMGMMHMFDSMVIDVPMPQAGCFRGERILIPGTGKAIHPCQKPLAVVRPFLDFLPIGNVLDPFAGSGTTAVAAMKSGRRCVLVEKDARYLDVIRRRVKAAETPLFAGLDNDPP